MLILNRSSLVLPIIEKKIEEVLRCKTQSSALRAEQWTPTKLHVAAAMIAYGDGEQALKGVQQATPTTRSGSTTGCPQP
jgi:hypothetical protein